MCTDAFFVGFMERADKCLSALKRMRAGMRAEHRIGDRKKNVKKEMGSLFPSKKPKVEKCIVWRHRFNCLAYRDQLRIPTSDADKDELFRAGLGEKEIEFDNLDMSQEEFKESYCQLFRSSGKGGGFQFLKGLPNSRKLETLSMAVHSSPGHLKQRVGNARTYIRPVQRDLDLTATSDIPDGVSNYTCSLC